VKAPACLTTLQTAGCLLGSPSLQACSSPAFATQRRKAELERRLRDDGVSEEIINQAKRADEDLDEVEAFVKA
jgi:hypothetical protein